MSKYLEALNETELVQAARATAWKMAPNKDEVEECTQQFCLGALEAAVRAEEGRAIRTLQWSYGIGYIKKYLQDRRSYNIRNTRDVINLHAPAGKDSTETVFDLIPTDTPDPREATEWDAQVDRVMAAIDVLPDREQEVVVRRYLDGLTLTEVGNHMGITKQRVQQIEVNALKRLRKTAA